MGAGRNSRYQLLDLSLDLLGLLPLLEEGLLSSLQFGKGSPSGTLGQVNDGGRGREQGKFSGDLAGGGKLFLQRGAWAIAHQLQIIHANPRELGLQRRVFFLLRTQNVVKFPDSGRVHSRGFAGGGVRGEPGELSPSTLLKGSQLLLQRLVLLGKPVNGAIESLHGLTVSALLLLQFFSLLVHLNCYQVSGKEAAARSTMHSPRRLPPASWTSPCGPQAAGF